MKRILLMTFAILMFVSCKKNEMAPEGPTDIRIKNISDQNFTEVVIKTSEYEEDVATIPLIPANDISEYQRFRKAYPKAEITAVIDVEGSRVTFSTGPVDYTYMQYLSTQRVTFKVYISDMRLRKLKIEDIIPDEALVVK